MPVVKYTGIGIMSGSSLDGVDICCVEFTLNTANDTWEHRVISSQIVNYTQEWKHNLQNIAKCSGFELASMNTSYGHYLGNLVRNFVTTNSLNIDYVASHGHTAFHQPPASHEQATLHKAAANQECTEDEGSFTFQIGDGETIASYLQVPVVSNFRAKDVALGGQGAPLVPVGEQLLFSKTRSDTIFLNLGGICNITIGKRAFDVSPCNMLLNCIAGKLSSNCDYDVNGEGARRGVVLADILEKLNSLPYYSQVAPKSLSREWFEQTIVPILVEALAKNEAVNLLRTAVEHITDQLIRSIQNELLLSDQHLSTSNTQPSSSEKIDKAAPTLFVTGGGAHNKFLMEILSEKLSTLNIRMCQVNETTVDFKEAIIFAFLGLRTLLGLANVSRLVTGAAFDSVSGSIHLPPAGTGILKFAKLHEH